MSDRDRESEHTFLPTYTGMPMIMAGMAMPAMRAMPTGAPTSVPSCQRIFFFRLHGFLPQNVQPDGLGIERGGGGRERVDRV